MRTIGLANDFVKEEITNTTEDECKQHQTDLYKKFDEVRSAIEDKIEEFEDVDSIKKEMDTLDECQRSYTEARHAIKCHQLSAEEGINSRHMEASSKIESCPEKNIFGQRIKTVCVI